MIKTAYLFPGQGSQFVGMGRDLYDAYPAARSIFDTACAVLDFDLRRTCFEGPEEELRVTHNTQVAIFTHSVAVLRVLDVTLSGEADRAAGHSLGEYSAYVAAGAISFADGLRLVRRRGELMHRAGIERPGAMAAILGLSGDQVESALASVEGVVCAANYNSPGQVVISGEILAVERAMEQCKLAGAKRAIRLDVGGAFHSPLMSGAAVGLSETLARTEVVAPRCVVLANESASAVTEPTEIRRSLERQLLSPVRWEQTVLNLREWGATRWLEIGPGKVLAGLVRGIDKTLSVTSIGTREQIEAFLEEARS